MPGLIITVRSPVQIISLLKVGWTIGFIKREWIRENMNGFVHWSVEDAEPEKTLFLISVSMHIRSPVQIISLLKVGWTIGFIKREWIREKMNGFVHWSVEDAEPEKTLFLISVDALRHARRGAAGVEKMLVQVNCSGLILRYTILGGDDIGRWWWIPKSW